MAATLSFTEEIEFEMLIEKSITARCESELERRDDPRDGGVVFVPLDETHLHDLLVELWGERLTADKIADIQYRLMRDGTKSITDWPLAWCEEIEDEKAEEAARQRERRRSLVRLLADR